MELFKWLALAFVLMLGPMILIHELGHFLTARRAGARVLEFGFGFPPRLFTLFREPGTLEVDGIQMLLPGRVPLPGYLAPGQTVEVVARRDPAGRLHVQQIQPTDAEPIWEENAQGVRCRGRLTALDAGTIYSLNLLPLGGFVRLLGEEDPSDPRSLAARPKRWRLVVLLSGAVFNILAAYLLITAGYATGIPTRAFVQIQEVLPDTPAQLAGLQAGDIVVAVDGDRLEKGTTELRNWIRSSAGMPLELAVRRGDALLTLTATPVLTDGHGYLGVSLQNWPDLESVERYPLPRAMVSAGRDIAAVLWATVNLPRAVTTGEVPPEAARPTGIPGILGFLSYALKQSVETGIPFYAIQVAAIISLALGLTNLLPLPALDGGRALFVLIEAVRGRRINPVTEAKIHFVGMAILVILSLFLVMQDIINPLIPWSWLNR